jgi:hypothetical protein
MPKLENLTAPHLRIGFALTEHLAEVVAVRIMLTEHHDSVSMNARAAQNPIAVSPSRALARASNRDSYWLTGSQFSHHLPRFITAVFFRRQTIWHRGTRASRVRHVI